MVLGNLTGSNFQIYDWGQPIQLPATIPTQQIETVDIKTGKKKFFTVERVDQIIDLVNKGFALFSKIKGTGTGQVVYQPPPPPPPKEAGFGKIATVLGGVAAAYVVFSLLMSKK
jgi:hypothetical protein